MQRHEPYAHRSIRYLERWMHNGWQLKLYGIAYRGIEPSPALVESAKLAAADRLPIPPVTADRYGLGFLGVHEGRGSNLMFLDWWSNENELHHHVFLSTPDQPRDWEYVTPRGLAACVWDLAVIDFERRAWIATVLAATTPDPTAYMARRLDGMF